MPTPYLSYRDADAALRFLAEAFGFTTTVRWAGDDGVVQHAEMDLLRDGTLMMGTADHAEPELVGQSVGSGVYVVVDDVAAHHERAAAAGARVVYPPQETEWGTSRYRALDLEGYEWSFGSYRPGSAAAG